MKSHLRLPHQNDRIFDIADVPFSQVSEEEKGQYAGKIKETGLYSGYKLRQYWVCADHDGLTWLDADIRSTSTMAYATKSSTLTVRHMNYSCSLPIPNTPVVHHAIFDRQEYPKAMRPLLPEIRSFTEHNHFKILHPILQYVVLRPFK